MIAYALPVNDFGHLLGLFGIDAKNAKKGFDYCYNKYKLLLIFWDKD